MAQRTLEIPLKHEQVLEVICSDLPSDPSELTNIFEQESVAFSHYCTLAIEYYQQSRVKQAIQVLDACLENANRTLTTQPREKLPILTLCATMHLALVKASRASDDRRHHLDTANRLIQEADRIHAQHVPTAIVKANIYLTSGRVDQARSIFTHLLDKQHDCIPARTGLAKIQYVHGHYREALAQFQKALQLSPPPIAAAEIKLTIAQCFAHLGMSQQAKDALKRCMQQGSINKATCLALMAIIDLNISKDILADAATREKALASGLRQLQDAFKAERYHPVVLNLVANHCHNMGHPEKSMEYAKEALEYTNNKFIKSEALFQIARAYHVLGNFEDAKIFYQQCLAIEPNYGLAQYHMGQIHMHNGNVDDAIKVFEKLQKTYILSDDISRTLGAAYAMAGKNKQALSVFNGIVDYATQNSIFAAQVGNLHEDTNIGKALEYYEMSIKRRDDPEADDKEAAQMDAIKVEVLNNLGTLYMLSGDLEKAADHYKRALEAYQQQHDGQEKAPEDDISVTVSFNLGRVHEERGELDQAKELYTKIVDECPDYYEARLRLGAIEQALGHTDEAVAHFNAVAESQPKNPAPWIMIARAEITRNEKTCKRALERVLRECDRDNVYAHVALGNYHATVARELKGDKYKQHRQESYKLAFSFFSQALRRDPKCAYAANGIAMLMADSGDMDGAHYLFNLLRESTSEEPSVLINCGHTLVELKRYREAIAMYSHANRLYPKDNKDENLLLCLGRALFLGAKASRDLDYAGRAIEATQKAHDINPDSKSTLYDLALTQQSYGELLNDMPAAAPELIEQGISKVESSQQIFRSLINNETDNATSLSYDKKITEQRARYGETLLMQLKRKLQERTAERDAKRRREEAENEEKEQQQQQQVEGEAQQQNNDPNGHSMDSNEERPTKQQRTSSVEVQ